ncbi:MAG: Nramp family divalent metal transporter [Chlorobiota bacterium]|nr:MAG: Nramp family divalent metal transporter [Chlorobiota bacterium]
MLKNIFNKSDLQKVSLPEVNNSVTIPKNASFFKKLLAFSGPGYLVAVGYMDPGNWATDIAGGSKFGFMLLSVILISNFMAIILQSLALKLGIVTGRDLAQACHENFSKPVSILLWVFAEIAIIATDLAEVIGSAIALKLLFGIPLVIGVCITTVDVFALLYLQNKGFRYIEALVIVLISTIAICLGIDIILSKPEITKVLLGFIPDRNIVFNKEALYISIGILGATVMPHNLYLHSSVIQTRKYEKTNFGKKEAIKFGTIDSTLALTFALFVNAAILIVAAGTFHTNGFTQVAEIEEAHKMLTPLLGTTLASILFAIALLASGQNSTLTGTIAGQIVMEGFLNLKINPFYRRLITRLIAVVPAVITTIIAGENATGKLLILSQVVLSFQLSFAVIPLILFTSKKKIMGEFVNKLWMIILSSIIATIIIALNCYLLFATFNN